MTGCGAGVKFDVFHLLRIHRVHAVLIKRQRLGQIEWRRSRVRAPRRHRSEDSINGSNCGVKARQRFSDDILAEFKDSKGLRIRAGTGQHRSIGIWFVVVNDNAVRRGMPPIPWTALAVLIPNCVGFVLYFLMRKPIFHPCPGCGRGVAPDAAFCPRCGQPQMNMGPQPSREE